MNVRESLQARIADALAKLSFETPVPAGEIQLEHPTDQGHGDYATNVALVLAQREKRAPLEIAEQIRDALLEDVPDFLDRVEVAQPGFINFFLSPKFFEEVTREIVESGLVYGNLTLYEGKRILVEHSSPNLFKPFHVGHMMNNTIGESLVRLMKSSGAEVTAISYPSDVSFGIGKAVFVLLEKGVEKLDQLETLEEKVSFLGECYVEGTKLLEERPELEERVREITREIYEKADTEAYRAYEKGKQVSLDYFLSMTKQLGSSFDGFIFESEAGREGEKIVRAYLGSIFTESEGAIVFQPTEEDLEKDKSLHTRVFINREGQPTYEAKDLGLLKMKFERYHPDLSLFVTDREQERYFRVVAYVAGKIQPEWKEKTEHLTHGRMTFRGEKMSSRLGNTPIVSDILEMVGKMVEERSRGELDAFKKSVIAIAALKYSILRTQIGKSVDFDPDRSLSLEGDSGPYLQYTYARAKSLLRKAREKGYIPVPRRDMGEEVYEVERFLYRFPEKVEQAIKERSPHLIVSYVTELAQEFNSWYGRERILEENDSLSYRLALVEASAYVIAKALWMLGIEVLEEM